MALIAEAVPSIEVLLGLQPATWCSVLPLSRGNHCFWGSPSCDYHAQSGYSLLEAGGKGTELRVFYTTEGYKDFFETKLYICAMQLLFRM